MLVIFFILAALHFSGFVVLPLWLVFAPLAVWVVLVGGIAAVVFGRK